MDLFSYQSERKEERALIAQYEKSVTEVLDGLTVDNYELAVEFLDWPAGIRGFGPVKKKAMESARELMQKGRSVFLHNKLKKVA